MKKIDIIFILVCLGIISYAWELPYKVTDLNTQRNFESVATFVQDKKFNVVTSTPTASQGEDGNVWLFHTSTVDKIFVKINGTWKSIQVQ